MGCTGSGKSSFIKLISGNDSVETGDGLQSMTSKVQRFDFTNTKSGRKVTIVDTPGFDDSEVSDTEILKRITNFLLEEYDAKRKLNGLVYLHRTSDPRFGGQSKRNLRMFKELCGTDSFKSVVILTTFWDKNSSQQEGEMRESELKSNFFRPLVQEGATFKRHDRTLDSAQRVLDHIFTLYPVTVRITEEIRVEGKTLEQTAAGSVRREEVDLLISQHKQEIAEFQAEMDGLKGSNEKLRRELTEDKAELQKKLAQLEADRACLVKGLETETTARRKLEGTVEEQRQWRVEQEKVKANLLRTLETEKTARQKLEKAVDEQRSLRVEQEQDQAELVRALGTEKTAREKLERAVEDQRSSNAKREQDQADLKKALENEKIARQNLETAAKQQQSSRVEREQKEADLQRALEAERIARESLEAVSELERQLRISQANNDQARIRELERQIRDADDSFCTIM